jgi:hypothetical protein
MPDAADANADIVLLRSKAVGMINFRASDSSAFISAKRMASLMKL